MGGYTGCGRLIAFPLSTPPEIGALGGVGFGSGGGGGSSAMFTLVGPVSPVPAPAPDGIGATALDDSVPMTVVTPRLTGGISLAFADTSLGATRVSETS